MNVEVSEGSIAWTHPPFVAEHPVKVIEEEKITVFPALIVIDIPPPFPSEQLHDVKERLPSVTSEADVTEVNSNTDPFPDSRTTLENLFVPESCNDSMATVMSGISVRVMDASDWNVMFVKPRIPEVTFTSEYPLANTSETTIVNELNVTTEEEDEVEITKADPTLDSVVSTESVTDT